MGKKQKELHAICYSCGAWKELASDACPECGVTPEEGTEAAYQSLYLSDSYIGDESPEEIRAMLEKASRALRDGSSVVFEKRRYGYAKAFFDGGKRWGCRDWISNWRDSWPMATFLLLMVLGALALLFLLGKALFNAISPHFQ